MAIVCTIFKKGDALKSENYRGISLLDTIYKISLLSYYALEIYTVDIIINYQQCDFTKGKSTSN